MDHIKPDYDNCLVNLSNSVLKAFGAETSEPTLKMADKLLEKEYKNVVVLLMDASLDTREALITGRVPAFASCGSLQLCFPAYDRRRDDFNALRPLSE